MGGWKIEHMDVLMKIFSHLLFYTIHLFSQINIVLDSLPQNSPCFINGELEYLREWKVVKKNLKPAIGRGGDYSVFKSKETDF